MILQAILFIPAVVSLLNALAAGWLGVATLRGSRLAHEPGGGENRPSVAEVLGPLSAHAGWALVGVAVFSGALGVGLLTQDPWARMIVVSMLLSAAMASITAVAWDGWRGYASVVIKGLATLAIFGGVLRHVNVPRLGRAMVYRA